MSLVEIKKQVLSTEIRDIIANPNTIKVLATKDKNGTVHAVFKDNIYVTDDGNLIVYEIMESSQTNRNLTYSLWFNQHLAITIKDEKGNSWQIKGIPYKDHSTGKFFEKKYTELLDIDSELDISGIWEIIPDEIRLETLKPRLYEERRKYPILGHLDREFIG
ncbi:MAG: pyridoxamine 5'-phosphate oxidase family protein [Clostridiales bacterium]|nr:pyridoxamine 5'-phosphate oxidase family protein [Clostridiales bacterium]